MPRARHSPPPAPEGTDRKARNAARRGRQLTDRQAEVLAVIFDLQRDRGYAPTYKEIAVQIDLTPSTVQNHVERLIRKGILDRDGDGNRTLRIVDAQFLREHGDGLPDRGTVNHGEALTSIDDAPLVTVDAVVSAPPGCFVVSVEGNTLSAGGISDRDTLIVQPSRLPTNGEFVVAELDDGVAVVREYHGQRGQITLLVPGDRQCSVSVDQSAILGVVVAIVRSLV